MPQESYTAAESKPLPSVVVAGWLLAVASVLSVVLMTHHPSLSASTVSEMMAEISRKATISATVHGALIALVFVELYALTVLSCRLGLRRGPVIAGLMAQSTGVLAMLGAALISGFIVSDLAEHLSSADDLESARRLLEFSHMGNQRLAEVGVIAMSAAIVFWSVALISGTGANRMIGASGVLLGVLLAGAMAVGTITLHVHGMTLVIAVQVLWYLAVAVQMIRRKI